MSSPFYQPDLPEAVPAQDQLNRENAFRETQNALRRRILPTDVEQAVPDLQPLTPAVVPTQESPGILKLIAGGLLRQRLGIDIFANSRAKAMQEAQKQYLEQTNNMMPVSIDAIGQQISDPQERDKFYARVASLTPLERRILEAQNPGAFSALPAETLKLVAPGSVDPTDATLQQMTYFQRYRDVLMQNPNTTQDQLAAVNAVIERLSNTIGRHTTTLSPGQILVDETTGEPVARGGPQPTSADNFQLPDGRVDSAIPGTQKYFDYVAANYPRAAIPQVITNLTPGDKTTRRAYEAEALKARFARERLVGVRNQVLKFGELTRPFSRFLTGFSNFKDAISLASTEDKARLRDAVAISSAIKNEFALLVQNLTGAAASENQISDYNKILSNWDTYSPTQLNEQVTWMVGRTEDILLNRFVYDELSRQDPGLQQLAPWEMSGERAREYVRGAISEALRQNNGQFTEQEVVQQVLQAMAYEAGVSSDAIQRLRVGGK